MIPRVDDWTTFEFPPEDETLDGLPHGNCVYVFFWANRGAKQPFYAGRTKRLAGRMEDYVEASFDAPTDFKVGEAARYLMKVKRFRVFVRYKPNRHPLNDEKALIRELQLAGVRLLNDFASYNYRTADEQREKADLHRFCDVLVDSRAQRGPRERIRETARAREGGRDVRAASGNGPGDPSNG